MGLRAVFPPLFFCRGDAEGAECFYCPSEMGISGNMAAVIWIIIAFFGGMFALKVIYTLCSALVLSTTRGAVYVSTSRVRISAFIEAVPMTAADLMVDLGCGDGRALRMARKRYGVRAVGYELNLMAYVKARLLCLGRQGIEVRRSSFWEADLSRADVIFCYLFPDVMKDLSVKLKTGLKPGAVIVSCNFPLPEYQPEEILRPEGSLHNDPIYIYRQE
jgi:hypothetical protein